MDGEDDAWLDRELAGCSLGDERLNKRLRTLVAQIGSAMGQSIPLACQDWTNTKAAYRFFSNDRVSEADILADIVRRDQRDTTRAVAPLAPAPETAAACATVVTVVCAIVTAAAWP
jgi:hypothetical protein